MVQEIIEEIMITTTLLFIIVFLVAISTTYTSTVVSHSALSHGFESLFNILKTVLSGITDTCLCRDQVSQGEVKLFYPARIAVKMKATPSSPGVVEFALELTLRIPVNMIRGGLHDYDVVAKAYCSSLLNKWSESIKSSGLQAEYSCSFRSWSDGATAYYYLSTSIVVKGCRGDNYDIPGINEDLRSASMFTLRADYDFSRGLYTCSLKYESP